LISGVVCGITISALSPRWRAEKATPWAWLPALAVITPRRRSSADKCAIRLCAPRSLKVKIGCRSSRFKKTWLPVRCESRRAASRGVARATS
jgi:hypothetical protein